MVAPSAEEVRRHLCYELRWMLRAVVRFEEVTSETRAAESKGRTPPDSDAIALEDSALLHARGLIQFAAAPADSKESAAPWALSDILGTHRRKVPGNLSRFLDNWFIQLGTIRAVDAKWPKDLEGKVIANDDDERLTKVTEVVFKLLAPKHRTTTLETEAGAAYVELLERARNYFEQRTPAAFDQLTCD